MNAETLKRLSELESKATCGPWAYDLDYCDCGGDYPCSHPPWAYSLISDSEMVELYPRLSPGELSPRPVSSDFGASEIDAELITSLRNNAKELIRLAEIGMRVEQSRGQSICIHGSTEPLTCVECRSRGLI